MSSSWRVPGGKPSEKEEPEPFRTITTNVKEGKDLHIIYSVQFIRWTYPCDRYQMIHGRN